MKILVTGGAGYLGSVLVPALLARGDETIVFDTFLFGDRGVAGFRANPRCTIVAADIRDLVRLESSMKAADAVVHLAALVGDPACEANPTMTAEINAEATRTLSEIAGRANVRRLIFSSTCSNYGVSDPETVTDEQTPLKPISVYAETKIAAEEALLSAHGSSVCRTVFRFATIFGTCARMRFDTLLNEFVRDAACAKRLEVYGPSAWRPVVHHRDVVAAVVRCLELPVAAVNGQVFNIVGSNHQKRGLAELIHAKVSDATIEYRADRPDPRNYRVSGAKWNRLANPGPYATVAEGIDELLVSIRSGALGDPFSPIYRNAG